MARPGSCIMPHPAYAPYTAHVLPQMMYADLFSQMPMAAPSLFTAPTLLAAAHAHTLAGGHLYYLAAHTSPTMTTICP